MNDRLVLGTAQLGMSYGIANKTGRPGFDQACNIVRTAFDHGVTRFDTAQAYGESENVLGEVFEKLKLSAKVKVYSKLHPGLDLRDGTAVRNAVDGSLQRIRVERLEGLLLHHEDGLRFWDEGLGGALRGLTAQGKVGSIGVSFYTPLKAVAALDLKGIELLQVPSNILDHRFEDAGVFRKAQAKGKEIFVRSIFLQGLLLMPLDRVPTAMRHALPYLERLDTKAASLKLSRRELVLGYAASRWPEAFVLFGAETEVQVLENVRAFGSSHAFKMDVANFKDVPEELLNPALWPK